MARLHEHQGKRLLAARGIRVPDGEVVRTAEAARTVAERLGGRVVLKTQAWITSRKAAGGVRFVETADEAEAVALELLSQRYGNFPVEEVLVEELIDIVREIFLSLTIDGAMRQPLLLLDTAGGSGIEQRAATVRTFPVDVERGISPDALRDTLDSSTIDPARHADVVAVIEGMIALARECEATSVEINPLVIARDGAVVAADCRIAIDDYAVFRHPELGIEIARELDHPATKLERIAYEIEQADHRGTFYFAQLPSGQTDSGKLIGFHGAGGGGSMMSMDAISQAGFVLANFCDTSGNPSASKVYRAARVILSQPNLLGYFGSGSGVASQEQEHSAHGLAKAFCELDLDVPAVIRLGGNGEDRAVEILEAATRDLPARVEGYKKDDTPAFIAERFATLLREAGGVTWTPRPRRVPAFVGSGYSFAITGGTVWIDHAACDAETTSWLIEQSRGLLREEAGKPLPTTDEETIASKDSEFVALEVACIRAGRPILFVDLPIPGVD